MEMPKPSAKHEKLAALAGTWIAEEKIHPSPWDQEGGTATSAIKAKMDLDGFYLVMDYVQKRGKQVSYRGLGVFGYDVQQKRYTMHWFDSIGFPVGAPALGEWKGKTLLFQHQAPMGHSRYRYNFKDADTYTFRIENSQDGVTWAPFIEGTYERKPAK